jgi:TPP-dependent 2-oxoacid decarboxylase
MAISVADYIVRRSKEQNVDTIFGVPALFCYPFFEAAIRAETRRDIRVMIANVNWNKGTVHILSEDLS